MLGSEPRVFAIESNLHHLNPEYMPLEAEEDSDPSLDIFSFGHLALVTILQENSLNEAGKRSRQQEVDRRARFMQKARKLIATENGEIFVTIKQCLRNNPAERPNIMHVLETLHRASKFFFSCRQIVPLFPFLQIMMPLLLNQ